jgi:DNA-binding NarL/FixJ family response regulator
MPRTGNESLTFVQIDICVGAIRSDLSQNFHTMVLIPEGRCTTFHPVQTEMEQTVVELIKTLVNKPAIVNDRPRTRKTRPSERNRAVAHNDEAPPTLTAREGEVLRQLADGKTNKEIGAQLMISERTVETHRARLMRKLDLHSMNQLVRYAIRHQIIKP